MSEYPGITEFLEARLDELEADAKLAMREDLKTGHWTQEGGSIYDGHPMNEVVDWVYGEAWAHIAANDPAYVLADIAAKQQALVLHDGSHDCPGYHPVQSSLVELPEGCPTVRLLAQPYAGHPNFREEWRI